MTVIVSDSFNRVDSSSLGSTDSYLGGTAKTWLMYAASGTYGMGISANQAYRHSESGSSDKQFGGFDVGASNVSVTVTFANIVTKPILVLRATAANNYISLQCEGLGNGYSIYEYNGSTWTQKASIAGSASGDVLKVTLNGTSITVFKNGTQVATYTSTFNQAATIFGINSTNSSGNKFDNFIIEDLNTGSTPTTKDGTASIIGTGTLASTGNTIKQGATNIIGTGSLSTTATKIQNALASMVGTGALTATPVTIKNGQTSLVGQGLLVANADTLTSVVFVDGSVDFKGNGLLTTNGITLMNGNVTLQGQGIFTSEATTVHLPSTIDGVFNVLGTGFLTVEGEVIEFIKPEIPSLTIDVLVELLFEIENKIELSSEIENTTTIHTDLENKVSLTFNL